jgi:hypothetical protein
MERKPTDILEDEHHYILKVIGAMSVLAESLEKGEQVEPETFKNIVEFLRIFADKCSKRLSDRGIDPRSPNRSDARHRTGRGYRRVSERRSYR